MECRLLLRNPNLIPLIERAREILGESTIKKVFFDRGFYDGEHFDCRSRRRHSALRPLYWLNKKNIKFVCRGKQGTKVAEQVSEIPEEQYIEEKLFSPNEYREVSELRTVFCFAINQRLKGERNRRKKGIHRRRL